MRSLQSILFLLLSCTPLYLLAGTGQASAANNNSYFIMGETRSGNISPFTKWTGMRLRYDRQKGVPDSQCGKTKFHPCSVKDWRSLLESIEGKSLREQLKIVNSWSNEHPYIEDMMNWGLEDYWETPYEFMEINGDCEDYAISKYYSLRALGVSADKMRIIILQDLNLGGIIHAVLGVYDGGELFILDNQIKQVTPAMKIYHYRPVYGINEDAWWSYRPKMN
jgi:predicted transglutaminase-like cysteine proteinase